MLRSEHILKGLGNQYYRATYKSMGFTTEDLKRPLIGIANAWSECVPGHYNLRQVAQRVKDGIYRAGGPPIEFGVIGGCGGMGQGHDGMHFIMPSRELIANSIESMAQINLFDGLVLLGSCDKIVPGMLMAAARLDIPCIFLPGGPMEGGVEFDGRQADQTSATEAYGMLSAGKITEAEYVALEDTACPGCGSCSYLGTANTMCALAEALGMTLPDGGTAPATSAVRMMKAEETGVKIMELVEKNITARQIITDGSIRNAIKACLAMSGSTNAVMHLTAIAYEAELGIKVLDEFDSLSDTTPQLARMNPSCKYSIVDFYKDGGVPRLMENLRSMLETDVMTVTAHTLAENTRRPVWSTTRSTTRSATPAASLSCAATSRPTPASPSPARSTRACITSRARPSASTPRRPQRRLSSPARSMTATSSSSATKARRADPACARCSRP